MGFTHFQDTRKFRLEIISLATGLSILAFLACLERHVAPANFKVAELFCRNRFGEATVSMGFERSLVVDGHCNRLEYE